MQHAADVQAAEQAREKAEVSRPDGQPGEQAEEEGESDGPMDHPRREPFAHDLVAHHYVLGMAGAGGRRPAPPLDLHAHPPPLLPSPPPPGLPPSLRSSWSPGGSWGA